MRVMLLGLPVDILSRDETLARALDTTRRSRARSTPCAVGGAASTSR